MFSVKVSFKGKNFQLGTGISSFDDILNQIRSRFPNNCSQGIEVKHEGKLLSSFDQVKKLVKEKNLKSIKLEVQSLKKEMNVSCIPKFFSFPPEEKKSEGSSFISSVENFYESREENFETSEQEQSYKCFQCMGKSLFCGLCHGTGKLSENSPYIQYIDELVEKRMKKKQTLAKISIKKHEVKEKSTSLFSSESKPLSLVSSPPALVPVAEKPLYPVDNFKITVKDQFNHRNVELYSEVKWKFTIDVQSTVEIIDAFIIDEQNRKVMPFTMKRGSHSISVGPYHADKIGNMTRKFRFFYFNEKSELVYFGPRFGFSVDIFNPFKRKSLQSNLRLTVNNILKSKCIHKDPEYIIAKLNEMGIFEYNYLSIHSTLEDIIEGLQ